MANRDATRREAARQNLMGLSRDDLPALQALLKNNRPIAPSQAEAMHDIVTQIYLAGEDYPAVVGRPGFLGVSFQGVLPTAPDVGVEDNPHGVVVTERIPGFSGFRYLQSGDVIMGATELPDQPLRSQQDLTLMIGKYKDGDAIHLQVQRAGQTIIIAVILSARPIFADHPLTTDELHEFLRKRLEPADDYWDANFGKYIDESVS